MGRGGFHIPEGNSQAPRDAQEFFCMTSRDRFSGEFPDPSKRERGPDLTARSGTGGARPCPPRHLPPPSPLSPHIPLSLAGSRLVFLVQPPSLGRAGGSDDVAG